MTRNGLDSDRTPLRREALLLVAPRRGTRSRPLARRLRLCRGDAARVAAPHCFRRSPSPKRYAPTRERSSAISVSRIAHLRASRSSGNRSMVVNCVEHLAFAKAIYSPGSPRPYRALARSGTWRPIHGVELGRSKRPVPALGPQAGCRRSRSSGVDRWRRQVSRRTLRPRSSLRPDPRSPARARSAASCRREELPSARCPDLGCSPERPPGGALRSGRHSLGACQRPEESALECKLTSVGILAVHLTR